MVGAPVRGHALGCARSPEADLERLCLGHFSISRPSPRFLLVCLPTQRFRGGGVPSLRLPPARPPPGHSAPHADKSASSLDPPEKSVLTLLPAPLRPQALKPHREGSARRRGRGVGLGVRALLSGAQTCGWRERLHALPSGLGSRTWGSPPLLRRGARLSPRARTPAGPEAQSVPGQSLPESQGPRPPPPPPQPCREDAPSLRPTGAFQNHRHTRFHASAKSDAYRQSGQQMTILSAKRGKSGEGVGGGVGGERGKGAVVSWGKKTNSPASLPLLSLYCLSQEINLITASPHQACFCLCDLDHR